MNVENTTLHREPHTFSEAAVNERRVRSRGILTDAELSWCRANAVALSFDPYQGGWVPANCTDDLAPDSPRDLNFEFREWTVDDAPVVARMLSSEKLWRYLPEGFGGAVDVDAARALIELGQDERHLVWAALLDGEPIGQARLLFTDAHTAEVSYWLGQDHWGKGYGTAMVRQFCDRSMARTQNLRRLFARVHAENHASQRILEKAGFKLGEAEGEWLIFERLRKS